MGIDTIIGLISLGVGVFSLGYSIIGYKQAKQAAEEAEKAKTNADDLKKLIGKINIIKETRGNFQYELLKIREETDQMEKSSKLLVLLQRIQSTNKSWRSKEINASIGNLQTSMGRLGSNKVSWNLADNKKDLSIAEGLIEAYIDELGMQLANYADVNNS